MLQDFRSSHRFQFMKKFIFHRVLISKNTACRWRVPVSYTHLYGVPCSLYWGSQRIFQSEYCGYGCQNAASASADLSGDLFQHCAHHQRDGKYADGYSMSGRDVPEMCIRDRSASCETAMALARDYDGRVQVVDNQRISVTQRQSVLDALVLREAGRTAAEIKEKLEEEKMESSIYITLETLKYLKKGGRDVYKRQLPENLLSVLYHQKQNRQP